MPPSGPGGHRWRPDRWAPDFGEDVGRSPDHRWRPGGDWSDEYQAKFRWFRRLLLALLALTLLLPVLLAAALTAAFAGWTGAAAAAVLSLAVVIVGVLLGRFVFRGFRTVNDLMAVTGRLADGDYSARVDPSVPPALGPVVGSFNRMAERLERSDELRRRLLADVGHELRTPLTIIRGELEAMADGVHELSETEVRRLLVDVSGMERLLDDLKTLSTTEAGVLDLQPEPTDIVQLVVDSVARFRVDAAGRNIELVAGRTGVVGDGEPIMVDVDAVRIGEVITNLVSNALRSVDDGGLVEVAVSSATDRVTVSVTDNGSGIAPDQIEAIFDRFTKGRDSQGSGLGLTISRSLVEAHGGIIEASSVEGAGTTMTVHLPNQIAHFPPQSSSRS